MALSVEQDGIVHHPPTRHAKVLAVAGSGKSHTMVERCAYLIEAHRVQPSKLLAVMFGRTAADEFAARLDKRLGKRNAPASLTFHGLGTQTLKALVKAGHAPVWLFESSTSKAIGFAASVLEPACNKNGFKYPRMVAETFLGFVDRVKGDLVTPEQAWKEGDWDAKFHWFIDAYETYEKARAKRKLRFFSDLIYDPLTILLQNPDAVAAISGRYEHIIVDEYQDICESQQSLIRFTAGKTAKVMVVGDDDQTIYSWRGAKPSYILRDFDIDFPGATTYQLTRTWRYGPALSCAANCVIDNNKDRADKLCVSTDKTPATDLNLAWETEGGTDIMKIVTNWIAAGRKLGEIAILVRTYSKSADGQFALLQSGTPFRLEGGDNVSVLENKWVASLIGWLQVADAQFASRPFAGEPDVGSMIEIKKIINLPPLGLSWDGTNHLCKTVLEKPNALEGFSDFVRAGLTMQEGQLADKIMQRGLVWKEIRGLKNGEFERRPVEIIEALIEKLHYEVEIKKALKRASDADEQMEIIEAFVRYAHARDFSTIKEFLKHIDDLRSFSNRAKQSTDAIHMTSIHRSKGLEWPCVIMPGLTQGSFPHKPRRKMVIETLAIHLEDERRLFYVGMTRAREQLWLMCPPDAKLHQWLRAGNAGSPLDLIDGESASQFLYESNLYLSKAMPHMLQKNYGLKAGGPEMFNKYLDAVGITDRRVTKIQLS